MYSRAVGAEDVRARGPRDEDGLAADGAERADGAVHAARDDLLGALEESADLGSLMEGGVYSVLGNAARGDRTGRREDGKVLGGLLRRGYSRVHREAAASGPKQSL